MYEDKAPESVWRPKRRLRALGPVWEAGHDGRVAADVLGTWLWDGLLVTAVFDRLWAVDAATGEQVWVWDVPGRDVLSAMTDAVVDGVGLLAHWPDTSDGAEGATLTALDVASGKKMWSVRQDLDKFEYDLSDNRAGIIALAGARAMVATGTDVVALDARTGRQEWTVQHGSARTARIDAGAGRLVLVTEHARTATVRSVDVADGTVRWKKPLPVDGPVARVGIVSVDPLLLAVEGEGRRGPDCLLRLDEDGNTAVEIPLAGSHGTIKVDPWSIDDRRTRFTVHGDTLTAFVWPLSESLSRVAGFSLSTGRHLWTREDLWGIDALAAHRGFVIALRHGDSGSEGQSLWWGRVCVLDPADGHEVARRRLQVTPDEPYTLHMHGNRMLWVNKESRPGTPPVRAYDWR